MIGTDGDDDSDRSEDNQFCKDRFVVSQNGISGSFVFTLSKEELRREGGREERRERGRGERGEGKERESMRY